MRSVEITNCMMSLLSYQLLSGLPRSMVSDDWFTCGRADPLSLWCLVHCMAAQGVFPAPLRPMLPAELVLPAACSLVVRPPGPY